MVRRLLRLAIRHGLDNGLTYDTSAGSSPGNGCPRRRRVAIDVSSHGSVAPAIKPFFCRNGILPWTRRSTALAVRPFGVHLRAASRDFVELGSNALGSHLHMEWAAQASRQLSRFGSVALTYARQTTTTPRRPQQQR